MKNTVVEAIKPQKSDKNTHKSEVEIGKPIKQLIKFIPKKMPRLLTKRGECAFQRGGTTINL
jgi:hypothetical protein